MGSFDFKHAPLDLFVLEDLDGKPCLFHRRFVIELVVNYIWKKVFSIQIVFIF